MKTLLAAAGIALATWLPIPGQVQQTVTPASPVKKTATVEASDQYKAELVQALSWQETTSWINGGIQWFKASRADILRLERCSVETLETLYRLSETTNVISHMGDWVHLIELGASLDKLRVISQGDIEEIVADHRAGLWPDHLVHDITNRSRLGDLSIATAEADPDFSKGVAWVRSNLQSRLAENHHLNCRWAPYHECSHQLDQVQNPHILFLLKGYLDYFESEQAAADMTALFPKKKNGREQGGLIKPGGKLIPLTNGARKPRIFFNVSKIAKYVPHLGGLHTHVYRGGDISIGAGPGGNPTMKDSRPMGQDDMGSLFKMARYNPYAIDVVVSQLTDNCYDLDAYFLDYVGGRSAERATVIDIGAYRWP